MAGIDFGAGQKQLPVAVPVPVCVCALYLSPSRGCPSGTGH